MAAASAPAAALASPPEPPLSVLLRTRGSTNLVRGSGDWAPLQALPDSELAVWAPDGSRLALVTAAAVLIFDGPALERRAAELPISGVTAATFSPDGRHIVTWNRKARDERDEPNLLVHATHDGRRVAAFHQRVWDPEAWPAVSWTADGRVALRTAPDGVHFFAGGFDPPEPLHKLPAEGVTGVWVGGAAPPYRVLTFVPRSKARPAAAALWAYPPPWTPLATKSLQADAARASFAPDAGAVLVEMSTSASDSSYYGDSRLFLLSRDGRVSAPVPGLKEGPTHDFCWGARGDVFVVIAGKSPPVATLHDGATGAALFSFGSGAFNTARLSPQGRFLMLGGFGNMAGDVCLWDVNKRKPLAPKFNAPCTVAVEWSPDGRWLLTSTTRPRMNVDNGFRVYSHRGQLSHDERHEVLLGAAWRPAPAGAHTDRAASPPPAARAEGDAAAGGRPVPVAPASAGAAYVPPHLRGRGAGGVVGAGPAPGGGGRGGSAAVNVVAAMMREDHVGAKSLVAAAAAPAPQAGAAAAGGVPGAAVPVGGDAALSASQRKRLKERQKREKEREAEEAVAALAAVAAAAASAAARAAAPATGPAPAAAAAADDPDKLARKLAKKLREIDEIKGRGAGALLTPEQVTKLNSEAEVRRELAAALAARGDSES